VSDGRDFLVDHLARPVRIAEAAAAAGLSPFHFHRTFKLVFGIPPRRYVSERRLERAAYLLRQTSQPILDISLHCGFESLGSFGKAFARRFGMSPGRYRAGAK
jgi:AraC-like DNA-binding protein